MTKQQSLRQSRYHRWLLSGLALLCALALVSARVQPAQAATTDCTPNGLMQNCTVTFDFTSAAETWTVPNGVTQATFNLYGAQGRDYCCGVVGGRGGRVTATLDVTAGSTYQILVGGSGVAPMGGHGFNGGGGMSNVGGGASDVRTGGFALTDRILVAGGGGSAGSAATDTGYGGDGGYPNGGNGGSNENGSGGYGGTQTGGGAGGANQPANAGSLGQGGDNGFPAGGGGGGYYGGGGGFNGSSHNGAGGGGGSSYGPTGATYENGAREGHGLVTITYTQPDVLAPVANPTLSPAPAPSGWNNTDVTVNWNWTDPITGSASSGIDAANCTTSSVSSGSGAITLSATCRDIVGNVGTATHQVFVDPSAPIANPSQSPAANGASWNNSDVTVNWNWVSTGAEIDTANCTTSITSSGEGNLPLSATCRDVATNQRTVPYTVQVDKTPPVVTVDNVNEGDTFTLGSVPAATCVTNDAISGVATEATTTLSGGNPDGTGNFTITCNGAVDNAGNTASATVNYTVSPLPDSSAPVITPSVVGTMGNNGWYISDVTVSWSVVDDESAISDQSGCETQNVTTDTADVTFTCTATSSGGSSSQNVTLKLDKSAPTLAPVVSPHPVTQGTAATATANATDGLSGVATQSCGALDTSTSGDKSITCTATDNAGNTATASVNYTVNASDSGTLIGTCGGYEVRQNGNTYTASGWTGRIQVGTNRNNTLKGTNDPDLILGLGGNDWIDGKGGNDVICGGDGVDFLKGLAGNDYLDGGKGNDVLNGGTGDHDELSGGEGNDTLLDGDGVKNTSGGASSDLFVIALRNGWRDSNNQAFFNGLSAGYGNDVVGLAILDSTRFYVDITGDERDNPASNLEGNKDGLALLGVLDPNSKRIKFEAQLAITANDIQIPGEDVGSSYLTEPVGDGTDQGSQPTQQLLLPLLSR